jgi:hypothetical protein
MAQQLYDTSAICSYESIIDNYEIIIKYNGLIIILNKNMINKKLVALYTKILNANSLIF